MNFTEYQTHVLRTASKNQMQIYTAFGLAGESGEVIDILKKHHFHGHVLDVDKLKEEMGDTLFYLTAMAESYGLTLDEIARFNVAKLQARYPDGFSKERSINR